jgi:hypothetical protein
VTFPRTPSQRIVTFALMSTPGSNVDFLSPWRPIPRSPVRIPTTVESAPFCSNRMPVAENPVKMSMPSASTSVASH